MPRQTTMNLLKVYKVIDSCNTFEQMHVANRMIYNVTSFNTKLYEQEGMPFADAVMAARFEELDLTYYYKKRLDTIGGNS